MYLSSLQYKAKMLIALLVMSFGTVFISSTLQASTIRTTELIHNIRWLSLTRVHGSTRVVPADKLLNMQLIVDKGRYFGATIKKYELIFIDRLTSRRQLWFGRAINKKSKNIFVRVINRRLCNKSGRVGLRITMRTVDGHTILATRIPPYTILFDCKSPDVESIRFAWSLQRSQPEFYRFSGQTRFSPCMDKAKNIMVRARDDLGIYKIAVRLSHPSVSLRVYPPQKIKPPANRRSRRSAYSFHESLFRVHSSNKAAKGALLTVKVTDFAGHQKEVSARININGKGRNNYEFRLASGPSRIRLGRNIVNGGSLYFKGCAAVTLRQFSVQLKKILNRSTLTSRGRVVFRKRFRLQTRRSPFLISYRPTQPGFYRLVLVVGSETINSSIVEVTR